MVTHGRVALATATGAVDDDADLPLLLGALRERGLQADAVPWDDERCNWSAFDGVVIRSTWDYSTRLGEFLAWTERVERATLLCNPAEAVRWNSDKRYLTALAGRGFPTLPTRFLAPGDAVAAPGLPEFVVKPAVSAGARDTARYTAGQWDRAAAHIRTLQATGETVMVQPYLPQIADGERALVFLGGEFSHAILKGPVLVETGVIDNARAAHPDPARYLPDPAELRLARAVLASAPGELLYGRVDLARGADGSPVVMELELIEPNLFAALSAGGAQRFAAAVEARLTST